LIYRRGEAGGPGGPAAGPGWGTWLPAGRGAANPRHPGFPGGGGGAARPGGLVDGGRVVHGCNVENASYGLGLCAECGLVSALHASGGGRLVAVVCVDRHGDPLMPCGRCRQLLWENGGPECLLETVRGVVPLTEVLPDAFDARDLSER